MVRGAGAERTERRPLIFQQPADEATEPRRAPAPAPRYSGLNRIILPAESKRHGGGRT
jgi:hypothetical protein